MTRMPGRVPTLPPTLADVAELRGGLAPDRVERRQQPRPAPARHPGPRAGGDRRARLLAQPRRPQPPHPHLPPDRAAVHARPGGHRQRADGPLRPLAGRDVERGRLPRAALPGRPEDPLAGYDDLLRSTAVDAFVATDTYLGNPQAAWLESRRAPFVAFGRPWDNPEAGHPWIDVDGAAGTELATIHLLDRGHERIAWIGWRKDSWIGEDRRAGLEPGAARPRAAHDRPRVAGRGHRRQRARGIGGAARRGPADRRSSAPPTPSPWACCTPWPTVAWSPGSDIAVVGFDDSQVAQVVPPGLTSVRQPLEEVAVEIVEGARGSARPSAGGRAGGPPHARADRPRLVVNHCGLVPNRNDLHSFDAVRDQSWPVENGPGRPRQKRLRPEVDRVVDLGALVVGQDRLGHVGLELDPDDALEVGPRRERPPHVHRGPGPAAGRPEPLDGVRVDLGVAAPEPPAERRPGRVVVDDERGPAPAYDAVQLGQARFAAGPEEVGPPGVHHVDRRVRQRQRLRPCPG